MSESFSFMNYDFVGFDLDNTLCQYNLENLFISHYEFLMNYMTREKNYKFHSSQLSAEEISFITRGLFIDRERGNLLKTDRNGVTLRASHGTQLLDNNQIAEIYGESRIWDRLESILENPVLLRSSGRQVIMLSDFTDMTANLIYAKAVDVAAESSKKISDVWSDVLQGIVAMYHHTGQWVNNFKKNVGHFTHKNNDTLINWLQNLKSKTTIGLITSADPTIAGLVAQHSLGPNWKSLFNFIVYSAAKPFFFTGTNSFYSIHSTGAVDKETEFSLGGEYVQGSFNSIEKALTEKLGRIPRCLYIGDSPINDLLCPFDSVAISEEVVAEGRVSGDHPYTNFLTSLQWGSLFYEETTPTWLGSIIMNTKFCSPSIQYFTKFPLEQQHTPFWLQ